MRILGIRFKNLNSLTGEWHIDFTHPEYASEGIFAITGPTGAGKTTILDAVCLGLYGRTPRLDKVTKSSNEIMSRQTGECFAEVTFETQKGRYRCHWSQHKARKKPEGELQPARHEVADAESGTVLESRLTQVAGFIEETTGMDFDRFTRSMLLAQGGFAAFLQAPPDERSPILEQITGTEIYSLISMKVHERRTGERDKLDWLLAELKGIQLLSAQEESALQTDLKARQSQEAELGAQLEILRKAASWLETVADLEKGICALDQQKQDYEKRRLAFEPQGVRLEKSRKALGLEGDYRGVRAFREQQGLENKECEEAVTDLPKKVAACEEALAGRLSAEAALNKAREQQQSEAEVIKKVREIDARLSEQKKRTQEMDKTLIEAEKQGRAYTMNIDKASQALAKSGADLKIVLAYQTQHAPDAALLTHLSAISRAFTALRDLEGRFSKHQETLAVATKEHKSAFVACEKAAAANGNARQEFEKGQGALKALSEEIAATLQGREISHWHQEKIVMLERETALKQLRDAITRIDKTSSALDGLTKDLETHKAGQVELAVAIKTCTEHKTSLEGAVANLETQVTLLNRIRDLEEERRRLEDGQPCPLCGALDHPYATGNIPELSKAESELKSAKAELKDVSDKLSKLEAEHAKLLLEIRHVQSMVEEKKAALALDEKGCEGVMLRLSMQATPAERAARIDGEITAVQKKIAGISGLLGSAEVKMQQEKSAQKALEKLRICLEDSAKALQDSKHEVETAEREQARLTMDTGALKEEIEKARAAALGDVEPFGIKRIPPSDLDTILKDLTERRDTWQAKQSERTDLEKKAKDLQSGIEKDKALLDKLEQDLSARRKERDDLLKLHESLSATRSELYGTKSADDEEHRLADTLDQAAKAYEKARDMHAEMEKLLSALKAKIDDLKTKTQQRAAVLVRAEESLMERITKAGFKDEADYLSACLHEEERERLAEQAQSLMTEKTELDARIKDKTAVLKAEREKHLTEQSLDTVKTGIDAADAALKRMRTDLGGILGRLNENEKLRERQRERIKTIDAQKMECARWDDLHQLIGSADGKKFRNFAQGLAFEMMTKHANRQLRKMTDRYLLIRDAAQPLELNVIDNDQAGEIRSTKNLSGGESFIVSLALALGLSQMSSRKVRVDSLFLDEGFGTLDEDVLEAALETLAGLRQEGKLIGVISHVTVLKERIGTQIQVTPETGGRSSLTGPGCRRI